MSSLIQRKELTESELQKIKEQAAQLYMKIAIKEEESPNDLVLYNILKSKIADLTFDLAMINELIQK